MEEVDPILSITTNNLTLVETVLRSFLTIVASIPLVLIVVVILLASRGRDNGE